MSENGPLATTIDCADSGLTTHIAFTGLGSGDGTVIEGFTVSGAEDTQGPVLNVRSASPIVRNCIMTDNVATISGGAVRCKNASPTFVNCTFVRNTSPVGSTAYLLAGSEPRFVSCIIAFSTSGAAIEAEGSSNPTLTCCDLFGNVGGDWTGVIASQADSSGNFSLDPTFCNASDYRLDEQSPCRADTSSCGVLVGATAISCE